MIIFGLFVFITFILLGRQSPASLSFSAMAKLHKVVGNAENYAELIYFKNQTCSSFIYSVVDSFLLCHYAGKDIASKAKGLTNMLCDQLEVQQQASWLERSYCIKLAAIALTAIGVRYMLGFSAGQFSWGEQKNYFVSEDKVLCGMAGLLIFIGIWLVRKICLVNAVTCKNGIELSRAFLDFLRVSGEDSAQDRKIIMTIGNISNQKMKNLENLWILIELVFLGFPGLLLLWAPCLSIIMI